MVNYVFISITYKEKSNLLGDILSETNKELELFRQRELKGIILRSKANWTENVEQKEILREIIFFIKRYIVVGITSF